MSATSAFFFDLQADHRGRILTVLAASPGLAARLVPGSYLAALVADRGAAGLLDFLLSLRRAAAALSSPLEPAGPVGVDPSARLLLGGFLVGQGARIWGADSAAATRAHGANLLISAETQAPAAAWRLFPVDSAPPPLSLPMTFAGETAELRRQLAAARAEIADLRRELAHRRGTPDEPPPT